jgi:hypothetical protein
MISVGRSSKDIAGSLIVNWAEKCDRDPKGNARLYEGLIQAELGHDWTRLESSIRARSVNVVMIYMVRKRRSRQAFSAC